MKPAKVLYFVDGNAPKPEDFEAAAALSANVVFRNARAVPSEAHSLEICDGVAGKVPPIYAEKFPSAEEAVAKKTAELKKLASKVGDEPAPKSKAKDKKEDTKGEEKAAAWKPNAPAKS